MVALVGALAIWWIYRTNSGWAYDTNVYRMGASIVLHGGDLYATSTPHPYTYPPFSALLFIPLALLPPDAMAIVWTAISLAAFFVVTWISLGTLSFPPPPSGGAKVVWVAGFPAWAGSGWGPVLLVAAVCFLAVWLDPIADTLLAGQVNLVVLALVLGDLLLPDSNRWKGLGVGFSATFKVLPLFFVVYLMLTRRTAAAVRAVATFLATVLIGFIVLPRDSITYWSGTLLNSTRVGNAQNPRSESLLSLLVRWGHSTTGVRSLWLVLELVVAIAVLALAVWAHRRGDEFLAVLVAAAGPLFLSPITWRHHWVWMLPMVLWLISFLPVRRLVSPPPSQGSPHGFPPPLAGEPKASGSRDFPRGHGRGGGFFLLLIPTALIALDFYLRPYGSIPVNAVTDLHLDLGQLLLSSTHPLSLLLFLASAIAVLRGSREVGSSSTIRRHRQPSAEARPTTT